MLKARELAAQTPATRNRYIDLLRVLAIFVVVVGHWLMAGVQVTDGGLEAENMLEVVPALQYLTWLLQVMPVFFIVGGFANAASWEAAAAKGSSYSYWLRARMTRLLQPVIIFVAVWTVVTVILSQLVRLDTSLIKMGMQVIAVPVWFLAVYLLVIPAVPAMLSLHRRYGVAVIAVSIMAAVVVDRLIREGGLDTDWGMVNYVFVWFAVHQLGFFWREGRLRGRAAAIAATGLFSLVALSASGLYVRSLIGVGDEVGNTQPPSVMLFAVALLQLGIALGLEGPARRWLEKMAVWSKVIAANAMIMTVYLWHLPAMVLVILAGYLSGIGLTADLASARWWWERPMWLAVLILATAPLVAAFVQVERRSVGARAKPGSSGSAVLGSLAAALGMGWLAKGGFYSATGPWGLAIIPVGLIAVAAVLLGQYPWLFGREPHRDADKAPTSSA